MPVRVAFEKLAVWLELAAIVFKLRTKRTTAMMDTTMNLIGKLLPQCTRALELVEAGIQRDLNPWEAISLRYHGNLCLYCSCKKDKFEQKKREMHRAKMQRREAA